ncbi:MAG: hybrid sensor histidine kinase/response regulator [Bacteroidales bacterium]|nr:hybrid sensor histidine kinase/response regulator [Clostridium sp.]MCM1204163.1 hybrid sensor histidine kinase/response regulator [Bacteroidales bacterium]
MAADKYHRKEVEEMGLLDAEIIEDLLHSSSISKGIERTMERMINELEIDSMYIIRYEEDIFQPETVFDWESGEKERGIDFLSYIKRIEEWYHFDEEDMFVARATTVLPSAEKQFYLECGYEAAVEYRMTNHGKAIGYILIGWNRIKDLSDEDLNAIHILLKLMNEKLIGLFHRDIMGENDWHLFKLLGNMTGTMLYMIDEDYKIQYCNSYARKEYPDIKAGDYCYKALQKKGEPCKNCPIRELEGQQMVEANIYLSYLEDSFHTCFTEIQTQDNRNGYALTLQRLSDLSMVEKNGITGKKFIFALQHLYKDIIAVELRRDNFYNLITENVENKYSYSLDFVLKWLSKVHLDDKQKFLECFDISFLQNDYAAGIKQKEIDFRYRTHEGSYHCMNGQILFEQNINKDVMAFILFQDVEQIRSVQIEEYKQLRDSLMAARSSAELKGQVLANISHEIRNPMGGIISMSSVARQVYKNEERLLECLSNIDDYADHMMQVMDSLLETVKVDDNAIIIARQPFRLESLLNNVDIVVREKIEKKNVQFYVDSYCQYNQLLGDAIRLQQALTYLINNAVSYVPISGEIRLTAKQVAVDSKTVYIRFFLDDTGNGMTEKMKKSIFGFSNDMENGIIEEQHFDLSLASRIVQLMGGQIGMEINGSGTHLNFTLPFELQEQEKNKSSKRKKASETGNFDGKKILLAEDSDLAQDAIRAVLEIVGFTVDTVENGRKAVVRFVSQPAFTYDAILMDVHMPFMDGREATKCIRISGKEDGETIPIIGLMANTYDQDIEESLKAGMQAHLAKPVDVDTLYRVLKKVIPDKEEQPE